MFEISSAAILIVGMLILFGIGIPIAFSIAIISLLYALIIPMGTLLSMPQRMTNSIDSFALMSVPFFILMGELMNTGGITNRIFKFADDLIGHLNCGLAHVNVVGSMIFAGMSGSAVADATGLGSVEVKAMLDRGYDRDFTAAVTAASATIGPLIPPSIPFVIYGSVTSVSTGRLLLGGAIPGIMLGGLLMLYIHIIAKFKTFPKPHPRVQIDIMFRGFLNTFPALLTPIILIGGIISGFFTPTEASAVACAYALILSVFIYKELKWKNVVQAFIRSAIMTSQIFFIISAAGFLGIVLAKAQVPQFLMDTCIAILHSSNVYTVLFVINAALLVMGCFIDTNPILIIVCPLLIPITQRFGIDPVYFGVIVVFNLMIALLTPPVGMVTYAVCRVANCKMDSYSRALLPFLGVMIVALIILVLFPPLSTFLPNLFFGKN